MTWLTVMEYLCHKWPRIRSTCLSTSWHITWFVTRLTRWVSLVEQELLTLPEHLSSSLVFSGVHVTRSIGFIDRCLSFIYVCFVDCCLSFCTFFFWSLCCLFFFNIWILITPLVSSNSSYYDHLSFVYEKDMCNMNCLSYQCFNCFLSINVVIFVLLPLLVS
jgi:hypothetical protein